MGNICFPWQKRWELFRISECWDFIGNYDINPDWIEIGKGKMFIAERDDLDSYRLIGKVVWISKDVI